MSLHLSNKFLEKNVNIPTSFEQSSGIDPVYNHKNYYAELKFRIQKSTIKAKIIRIQNQVKIANPIDVNINDKVWLKIENCRKLDPVYSGPFKVTEIKHPNSKIKHCTSGESQIVHKNRIVNY